MSKPLSKSTTFLQKNILKIIPILAIIFLLLIIKSILSSIITLQNNGKVVVELQNEVDKERRKEQFLKERLYYVNTPEFIEGQAREKLGMVKEGEYVILAPPATSGAQPTSVEDETPNWQKWWKLFF